MATYAIGDLQGCYTALQNLLTKINYHPAKDFLWFAGDLINRGKQSLECLRFVKDAVTAGKALTVLGNHDLHLLAVANNLAPLKPSDSLHPILDAADFYELCFWLRQQPLFHYDSNTEFCLVHAGLPPQWDLAQAITCAAEISATLKSDDYLLFLAEMYGNQPDHWQDNLHGINRLRFITNCFTRIRYCDSEGRLNLIAKGPLGTQPNNLLPWFQIPWRRHKNLKIIFGHWAALYENWQQLSNPNLFPLDSGCVWGNTLTALRLEDGLRFSLDCHNKI